MVSYKQERKALKEPDRFQVFVGKAINQLAVYKTVVWITIGTVLAVIGGVGLWQYFEYSKRLKRQEALSAVDKVYEEEAKAADKKRSAIDEQIKSLTKPAGEANTTAPTASKEQLEKDKDAIQEDHSGSLEKYKAYYATHKSYPEGWIAGMRAAKILIVQGKQAEAKPLLEEIAVQGRKADFFDVQSRLVLAAVYEDLGDYDNAIKVVDELLKANNKELQPNLLFAKGRLLLGKNDKQGATAVFDQLVKDHPDSADAGKARALQAWFL